MGGTRPHRVARFAVSATVALAVLAAAAPLIAGHAVASTGITITPGACAGGGMDFCFNPQSATATAGSTVSWTNQSGVAHTVTSCTASACQGAPASTGGDSFNVSIAASSGSTGSFTFTRPGTYQYYCVIHGYSLMHGTIIVAAAPASASPSAAKAPASAAGTPVTGAAPGPLGGVLVLTGCVVVILAAAARRR